MQQQKIINSKKNCILLLGVAPRDFRVCPRDLDSRSVLLYLRFVWVYPPQCTFLGGTDTPKWGFGVYGVPPPVFPLISEARSY